MLFIKLVQPNKIKALHYWPFVLWRNKWFAAQSASDTIDMLNVVHKTRDVYIFKWGSDSRFFLMNGANNLQP